MEIPFPEHASIKNGDTLKFTYQLRYDNGFNLLDEKIVDVTVESKEDDAESFQD